MSCSSLSELVKRSTGISLTTSEAGRLMKVMVVDGQNDARGSYANTKEDISERRLSREQFHNFFEYGVHPGKASQKRIASAAVILQDYIRHVAVAKMSVVRKSRIKKAAMPLTSTDTNSSTTTTTSQQQQNSNTTTSSQPLSRQRNISFQTSTCVRGQVGYFLIAFFFT